MWIWIYLGGIVLMLVLCGTVIGERPSAGKLVGAIVVSAIWPVVLPVMIGAMIREFAK